MSYAMLIARNYFVNYGVYIYFCVGSEKVKNDGQTKAEHLQESNNINKSLLVLGESFSSQFN